MHKLMIQQILSLFILNLTVTNLATGKFYEWFHYKVWPKTLQVINILKSFMSIPTMKNIQNNSKYKKSHYTFIIPLYL